MTRISISTFRRRISTIKKPDMPATTLTLNRKFSLYETLLFKVFDKLILGSLELELPDGHTLYFGSGNEVKARIRVSNNDFFVKSVL